MEKNYLFKISAYLYRRWRGWRRIKTPTKTIYILGYVTVLVG